MIPSAGARQESNNFATRSHMQLFLTATVPGLPLGLHGFHIHENPS
jgi:Cu/Zn superoxide dismutase